MHRAPPGPFALHCLGPPTDPNAEYPSTALEKHRRGKGAECSLWTAWQKRSSIHETLPAAPCDPGGCFETVSLGSSIITITPKCFDCGCYYGCYLALYVINVSIQNHSLEQTILNKNNTSAMDYY